MKSSVLRVSAVAAAATLLLSACATGTGGGSDDTSYDSKAALTGTLSITGFTSTTDEIAQTRYDLAVKAVGDDVTVKSDESGFDIQTFLSAVAGKKAPDLIYLDRTTIGTLAAKNALEPLEACMTGEGIDAGTFLDAPMSQVTLDGTVYGVPEFNNVNIVIADQNLLDAAGASLADVDGSDWDALAAFAEKTAVVNGGAVSVLGYDTKMPEFFPLWAKANGIDILSADGKTANLNDPKVVEAVEFAVGVYESEGGYAAVKAAKDASDFFGAGNQYATDTLGGMPIEQWYANVLSDVSPDAALSFSTFKGQSGDVTSYSSGSAWAIPTGSKNKEAACRFIRTMTETDSWVAAAQARVDKFKDSGSLFTGLLTANKDADAKIKDMVGTVDGTFADAIAATYEANDAAFTVPGNPADAEFKAAWTDAINRVLTGDMDAKASLDQAQQEAQDALDTAWASFGK